MKDEHFAEERAPSQMPRFAFLSGFCYFSRGLLVAPVFNILIAHRVKNWHKIFWDEKLWSIFCSHERCFISYGTMRDVVI